MYVCAFALLILPRTFTWKHTDTPRTLHLPRTQKRVLGKRWLKTSKTSCFTILGGVRAPRTSTDFQPYLIYEDIRVLGSISKASGCVCVCVCPAMRFVMLWGIELKVGMGVGDGPTRFVGIFSKRPHPGSKVIQRSIYLRNALWLPNLVKRTPGQSVVYCWGQRSCRGHQGSTKGQIA